MTMPRMIRTTGLALLLVVAGCAHAGPSFPLWGSAASFKRLAGTWDGTFSGDDGAVMATLRLTVTPREAHAHGEVRFADPAGAPRIVTKMRFLRMVGPTLEGELEPFVDPACGCRAEMAFTGKVRDDRLDGHYTMRLDDGGSRTGRWHADRRVKRGWLYWSSK